MYNGVPIIMLCGDGGSGKDTIAVILREKYRIPYQHSTSYTACKVMWLEVVADQWNQEVGWSSGYFTPEKNQLREKYNLRADMFPGGMQDFYEQRVNYRRFWADWIDNYNKTSADGARLYRETVQQGTHLLTGLRKKHEFLAFMNTGWPDLAIWVDRPGIPRDPTQEYGPELCDIVIRNDGDQLTLNMRLSNLIKLMKPIQI